MSTETVATVCCQCGATDLVVLGAGVAAPADSALRLCPTCAPKFLDNWTANWSALKFDGPSGERIRRGAEQLGLIDKAAAHTSERPAGCMRSVCQGRDMAVRRRADRERHANVGVGAPTRPARIAHATHVAEKWAAPLT